MNILQNIKVNKIYLLGSHYRLTVTISNSTDSQLHKGEIGQLWFTIYNKVPTRNDQGINSGKIPLSHSRYHEPGRTYVGVIPGHYVPELSVSK